MFRRFATVLVATLTAVGASSVLAPSAQAASGNGRCEPGEFCLYYGAGWTGSMVDTTKTIRNYSPKGKPCVKFLSKGSGQGLCVRNRASSVWNRTGQPVYVYYSPDFGGTYDRVTAGIEDLNGYVRKNNASQIVGDASLRFPLAVRQSTIKNHRPMWCWNNKTNCHHHYNAADIFAATGTRVLSPVAGTVTRVKRGTSTTASWVQIKDRFGRLWYLQHLWHQDGGLRVRTGQQVTKGTLVGFVGNRAQAFGTSPHLHIDMLVGQDRRPSCSAASCQGLGFVNNQPMLRTAFLALP